MLEVALAVASLLVNSHLSFVNPVGEVSNLGKGQRLFSGGVNIVCGVVAVCFHVIVDSRISFTASGVGSNILLED